MNEIQMFYGLKWNPFTPEIPLDGIVSNDQWDQFFWRVESLILDGGFAMITGESGLGKSVTLRALSDRISKIKEVQLQELSRPQSGLNDFYRELGSLFGLDVRTSNRYRGHTSLREKWQNHIDTALFRPVLVIDEAQEMQIATMSELRLLTSKKFDSQILLTVILAGDQRLPAKLQEESLLPLATRIRTRINLDPLAKSNLVKLLNGVMTNAGRPDLMTEELISSLVEHCLQNPRIMMNLASEILALGLRKKAKQLGVELFFELFPPITKTKQKSLKN
jgi:general secretion pathway protein A